MAFSLCTYYWKPLRLDSHIAVLSIMKQQSRYAEGLSSSREQRCRKQICASEEVCHYLTAIDEMIESQ